MAKFGKRTVRYLAALWIGAVALELVLLEVASRRHDAWLVLLALAILAVPVVATVNTADWLRRAPRKRWKRHDLEDERARAAVARAAGPADAAVAWPGDEGRTP